LEGFINTVHRTLSAPLPPASSGATLAQAISGRVNVIVYLQTVASEPAVANIIINRFLAIPSFDTPPCCCLLCLLSSSHRSMLCLNSPVMTLLVRLLKNTATATAAAGAAKAAEKDTITIKVGSFIHMNNDDMFVGVGVVLFVLFRCNCYCYVACYCDIPLTLVLI
jgi:hypothetical protein